MFRTLPMKTWDRSWEASGRDRIFISLDDCANMEDMLKRLGNVLKGSQSPALQTGKSADAFIDVLSDWFEEPWGETLHVYILGGRGAQKLGKRGIEELKALFDMASENAALERARMARSKPVAGPARISIVMAVDI